MKKSLSLGLLVLGLFGGGCSLGVPLSPLMFLIKDQPAPLNQATPDAPQPPPLAPVPPAVTGEDTTGSV